MLRIALTGGIGSGKSTVSKYFRELGVPVVDADEVSREITQGGQPAVKQIVQVFGDSVLNADGNLDRAALRKIVFDRPDARRQLESILHPEIRRQMRDAAARTAAPYCLFSIPLLIETGQQDDFDRVLVIEASEAKRRAWIHDRSELTDSETSAIFATQATDDERRQEADDLLINDGSVGDLLARVDTLHERYLALAREHIDKPD